MSAAESLSRVDAETASVTIASGSGKGTAGSIGVKKSEKKPKSEENVSLQLPADKLTLRQLSGINDQRFNDPKPSTLQKFVGKLLNLGIPVGSIMTPQRY
jgi:hypothetical protein